ncbi:MAG TPA: hypothetical protein VFF39_19860 [Verrucomicrobiae bacterium]|nr:hypothetical protein [Verrucomicrobiae bacterium]
MGDKTMTDKMKEQKPRTMISKIGRGFRLKMLGTLVVALLALAAGAARGNQAASPASAPAAQAKPGGEEMKRIGSLYVGNWAYSETYPKSGAKNTGVYTSKLGPGGNSLVNTFHSKGPVGEFEGMLVFTWDLAENKYKAYVFGDAFPGAIVETGAFEGDKLVFRGEFPAGPTKLQIHTVTWLDPSGKLISEQYMSRNGGPETLLVKVEASKE